ncbi:MAG: metallophosphoesterase [Clostridia bacterium]|nr:metallophosphoesterase [Clostridia bacterium]MBQ3553089.1 metallophosphoesterase [Clostridia bacterium]
MAIYSISDLHLSLGVDKPMEVFGANWTDYVRRLRDNWEALVAPEDIVLLPGDISWATYLAHAVPDFSFIEALPGIKVITKGNHDYWWETLSKMNAFLEKNEFSTIRFLHNTLFETEEAVICGTKGYPDTGGAVPEDETEAKLYLREAGRLEAALLEAKKRGNKKIIVMLHYPPGKDSVFAQMMRKYEVDICVYGHLHDKAHAGALQGMIGSVEYKLVSCDYLKFKPYRLL